MTYARLFFASVCLASVVGCVNPDTTTFPLVDPEQWCQHVTAGPSGSRAVALDWSAAHAAIRFFGADADAGSADQALSDALDAPGALDGGTASALGTYDSELLEVCALPADNRALPAASVEMKGNVALIHPGTGTVTLPSGTAAVAVDLRDLPALPEVRTAVESAVGLALAVDAPRGTRAVVFHDGLTDELRSTNTTFADQLSGFNRTAIKALAKTALPLALITSDRMAPEAAEIAILLRREQKAWIFGSDVWAAAAEACWQGIGDHGVAYRCGELGEGDTRWPDYIPADHAGETLDVSLSGLSTLGIPTAISTALPGTRPILKPLLPHAEPTTSRLGDLRAALLIAHGTSELFFPSFAETGNTLDDRLAETLATVDGNTPSRGLGLYVLSRFDEALHDGQSSVVDRTVTPTGNAIPLVLEQVNGKPVVRGSGVAGIAAGDQITAVNATPIDTVLADNLALTSASTDGQRVQKAIDMLLALPGTVTFSLTDSAGNAKPDVQTTAVSASAAQTVRTAAQPASGQIPGTAYYYLNADGSRLADVITLQNELGQANSLQGLVLDLRGSVSVSPYDAAARLLTSPFQSAFTSIPAWLGPFKTDPVTSQFSTNPISPYGGKMVILVGPTTHGVSENLALMLKDAARANTKIVGRSSAAALATTTAVDLPGDFALVISGYDVLHTDKTTAFIGTGIVPDVAVAPTAATLAAASWPSDDAEVTEAVNQLNGM